MELRGSARPRAAVPVSVPEDLFAAAPVVRYYSRAMYYRLLAAQLLPAGVDRVLYLDPDILVINALRPLYDTDLEGVGGFHPPGLIWTYPAGKPATAGHPGGGGLL